MEADRPSSLQPTRKRAGDTPLNRRCSAFKVGIKRKKCTERTSVQEEGKMNFIVIVSDTLRRDHLGWYGNEWISTPHLDAFAAKCISFERAYSGSFPTVPHRRDLMTGRFTSSYTPWAPLSIDEVVLQQVLSENGYITMMVADCPHILENGFFYDRGFDGFEWIRGQESDRWKTHPYEPPPPCSPAKIRNFARHRERHLRNIAWWRSEEDTFVARTARAAMEWLEHNYREKFFLYVDTFDPHEPWDAPQWYVDMYDADYDGEKVNYPQYDYWRTFMTERELKHSRALYAAEVTLVDRWIGRLLEKVEDLGLLENTVVIFTTDHGFLLGEHDFIGKSMIRNNVFSYIPLFEEINHIPMLVHVPGCSPRRTPAMVQPMDIMPTLLDLAGIEIPETVHGESFVRVIEGEERFRETVFSAPYIAGKGIPVTVVREDGTCGVIYSEGREEEAVDKAVDGFEKLQVPGDGKEMLFDLNEDPQQAVDISAGREATLKEMRSEFVDFLKRIGTPDEFVGHWNRSD